MLIYDGLAGHTFTLRQFILERGHLKLDVQRVDMPNLEHRRLKYRQTVNPRGEVPALRLDDGSVLTETFAICQYLDEVATGGTSLFGSTEKCHLLRPRLDTGTSLFGSTAHERAVTQMWLRRIDLEIAQPLLRWYRNGPESVDYYRGNRLICPESQLHDKIVTHRGLNQMDDELDDRRNWICGDRFSFADVYLYSILTSLGPVADWLNPPGRTNMFAWMQRVGGRKASQEAVNLFGERIEL